MKAWHGVLTIAVVATLLGLAFYDRMAGSENQALVQRMEAALSTGNAYRRNIGRFAKIQAARTVDMRAWRRIADTASSDTAKITALTNAANACEGALLACSERALLAESRVRELEPLLSEGLKRVDCHIGGLSFLPRCPSRVVTGVLMFGLGATTALVIH